MQEIKLHGSEKQQRWQWEHLQAAMFKVGMRAYRLINGNKPEHFLLMKERISLSLL